MDLFLWNEYSKNGFVEETIMSIISRWRLKDTMVIRGYSRDRVGSNFVSLPVQLLYSWVVGVLVGDEESTLGRASVGVVTTVLEDTLIDDDVVVVDGVIESDGDHLGNGVGFELAWNLCAVRWAIAVGQDTLGLITRWGTIGIPVDGYEG